MTKKILLIILLLGVFISTAITFAATTPLRITPLQVQADNLWEGTLYPWNVSGTKILIYEGNQSTFWQNPVGFRTPRYMVWGLEATLRSLATIGGVSWDTDFQAATYVVPISTETPWTVWSTKTGEDGIIYFLNYSTKKLQKYNTDTLTTTDVVSYTKSGVNIDYARIWGLTTDGNIIICFGNGALSNPFERWTNGGYEIDPTGNPVTPVFVANQPDGTYGSAEWKRMPWFHHGHTARSPDGSAIAYYGSSSYMGYGVSFNGVHYSVNGTCSGATCPEAYTDTDYTYPSHWISHTSWWANNDWFMGYDTGLYASGGNVPNLKSHKTWRVTFNRTTHTFSSEQTSSQNGAVYWVCQNCGGANSYRDINYGATPHGSDKTNGFSYVFWGTDGVYTYDDWRWAGWLGWDQTPYANWGNIGVWIVPSVCTSWTYSAWSACNHTTNQQTRTIVTSSPEGCTGGSPSPTATCEQEAGSDPDTVLLIEKVSPHSIFPKGMHIELKYTAINPDDPVLINFHADSDSTGFTTNLIAECIDSPEGTNLPCIIDTGNEWGVGVFFVWGTTTTTGGTNKSYIKVNDTPIKFTISECNESANTACAGTVRVGQ